MTLSKQTILILIGALTALLIGTYIITLLHMKTYFEDQMQNNAQDTSTALGLSLSKQFGAEVDKTTILSKVNAVFDRGFFCDITVKTMKGDTIVRRYFEPNNKSIPAWFKSIIDLQNAPKTSLIMHGWQQAGTISVTSDPNIAAMALWSTSVHLLILFLILAFAISLVSVILIKMTYKPLGYIIKQAEDIGQKKFYILDRKPSLVELRKLSKAINDMVGKLKQFFALNLRELNRLSGIAYLDPVTGKGNKRYFNEHLNNYLISEEEFRPGYLFLIELSEFAEYNRMHGYQEGNLVLKDLGELVFNELNNDNLHLYARMDAPLFAGVIFQEDRKLIKKIATELYSAVEKLLKSKDSKLACHIAVVKCNFAEDPSYLFKRGTIALQESAKNSNEPIFMEVDSIETGKFSEEEWKDHILNALREKQFNIYCQPVESDKGIFHKECFAKLVVAQREISAREFFPVAEKFQLGFEIDKLLVHAAIESKEECPLAINLSASTVNIKENSDEFLALIASSCQNKKLHFELTEFMLNKNTEAVLLLIRGLRELGHAVGLDRVGPSITAFPHLEQLHLSYMKLEGYFSKDLEQDKVKQELISKLLITYSSLDINLVATAIETQEQWESLKSAGMIYFQGNYISPQSPLEVVRS